VFRGIGFAPRWASQLIQDDSIPFVNQANAGQINFTLKIPGEKKCRQQNEIDAGAGFLLI
jgi:hypothetical protein